MSPYVRQWLFLPLSDKGKPFATSGMTVTNMIKSTNQKESVSTTTCKGQDKCCSHH